MVSEDRKKTIKFVLGGLVVASAFAVIMPGFIGYVFSLWRLLSLIVTILVTAWLVVYIWHRLKPKKKEEWPPPSQETEEE